MFQRIAQLLGFNKKDDALSHRFARLRRMYGEPRMDAEAVDVMNHMRSGLNIRTVNGAEKTSGELLKKNLLESYARSVEDKQLVGSKQP